MEDEVTWYIMLICSYIYYYYSTGNTQHTEQFHTKVIKQDVVCGYFYLDKKA